MKREIINNGQTSITFTIDNMQITLAAGKSIPINSDRAIKQFEELKKRSGLLGKVEMVDPAVIKRAKNSIKKMQMTPEEAEKIRTAAQAEAQKKIAEQQEALAKAEAEKIAAEEAKRAEIQKKAAEEAKKAKEAKVAVEQKAAEEKEKVSKEEARKIAKEEAAKLAQATQVQE